MNPFIRAFMVAAFTTISARAQQDTNPPPADFQSQEVPTEKQPEEDRIQFLLEVGSVYFSEEDPTSAITAFERILEIDPLNRQARYMSSYAYIATKQYAKAEQGLTSLIEEFPDDFALKNNLAWLYATAEEPAFRNGKKAVELAQEAMIIAPNDYNVWSTLAEAYYSTGQYEKADRAITHMTFLAVRYGSNISQETVESYKQQMRKYKRSLSTEKVLKADEEETSSTSPSVDEDAQEQQD